MEDVDLTRRLHVRPVEELRCQRERKVAAHLEHDDEDEIDDSYERDVRGEAKGMKCSQEGDRCERGDADRDPHSSVDERRWSVAIFVEGERVHDPR